MSVSWGHQTQPVYSFHGYHRHPPCVLAHQNLSSNLFSFLLSTTVPDHMSILLCWTRLSHSRDIQVPAIFSTGRLIKQEVPHSPPHCVVSQKCCNLESTSPIGNLSYPTKFWADLQTGESLLQVPPVVEFSMMGISRKNFSSVAPHPWNSLLGRCIWPLFRYLFVGP